MNFSMQQGLISVIVPVYNAEAHLNECVRTIQNQTYTNLEIILINDGSPDRSGEICNELAKKDKRIKVIHKSNGGAASARNAGLDSAKGEFVAFVDSDDTIEANMYECLYTRISEANADICICGLKVQYNKFTRIVKTPHERKMCPGQIFEAFLEDYRTYRFLTTGPWNKLIKREILANPDCGNGISVRFPETLQNAEDMWFVADCISAARNGIIFANISPYHYNLVNNPFSLNKEKSGKILNDKLTALKHLGYIMVSMFPDKETEIENFIECQNCVNLVVTIQQSILDREKSQHKITWSSILNIMRYSTNHMDKLSALMLYFLPPALYRIIYNLYNKKEK